jgi:hypothetical protein
VAVAIRQALLRALASLAASAVRTKATGPLPPRELDFGDDEDDWALPGDGRLVTACRDCLDRSAATEPTRCGCPRGSRECWQRMTYRSHVAGQIPAGAYHQGKCLICGKATHWAGTPHGDHEHPWQYCSDACYEIALASSHEDGKVA